MSRTARGWLAGIVSGLIIWLAIAFLGQFAFLALALPSSDSDTACASGNAWRGRRSEKTRD
jgi:hypothetical protein